MKLGAIIKDYRLKNSLTMQEFADRAGLSKGYISMVENEHNPSTGKPITPGLESYKSLANAMRMSLDELLKRVDPDSPVNIEGDNLTEHGSETYYLDPETARLAQEALEDPDLRILLSAKRDLSPEAMKHIMDTVKIWRKAEHPELYPEDIPDDEYPDEFNQAPEDWD